MCWIKDQFKQESENPGSKRIYHDVKEYFTDRCTKTRKAAGHSQEEFAAELGISRAAVTIWENPLDPSLPNTENQRRYREYERRNWMKENWSEKLKWLQTPLTLGVKGLLMSFMDKEAQAMIEYELEKDADRMTVIDHAYLEHVAGQTYAVGTDQVTIRGQLHAEKAYDLAMSIEMNAKNHLLVIAIRNEMFGYKNHHASTLKHGQERLEVADAIVTECMKMFKESRQIGFKEPILLWNGLEAACMHQMSKSMIKDILAALYKVEGKKSVNQRGKRTEIYTHAYQFV